MNDQCKMRNLKCIILSSLLISPFISPPPPSQSSSRSSSSSSSSSSLVVPAHHITLQCIHSALRSCSKAEESEAWRGAKHIVTKIMPRLGLNPTSVTYELLALAILQQLDRELDVIRQAEEKGKEKYDEEERVGRAPRIVSPAISDALTLVEKVLPTSLSIFKDNNLSLSLLMTEVVKDKTIITLPTPHVLAAALSKFYHHYHQVHP